MAVITYETAVRLFKEAHDFSTGKVMFIAVDSEIRLLANKIWHGNLVAHLDRVCNEIFRVIAEHYMWCNTQPETNIITYVCRNKEGEYEINNLDLILKHQRDYGGTVWRKVTDVDGYVVGISLVK